MEFRIRYYSESDFILGEEIVNYNSYEQAEIAVTQKLKNELFTIKRNSGQKEERIVIITKKVAKVSILDNTSVSVNFGKFY